MMMYQCSFRLGQRVNALQLPAHVVAITFREKLVQYEVEFDSGGANAVLDSKDITLPTLEQDLRASLEPRVNPVVFPK